MDGVCCKLTKKWLKLYNELTGENVQESNISKFEMDEFVKYPKILKHFLELPNFFSDLEPEENCVDTMEKICDEFTNVYILTTPYHKSETCERDKKIWISKYFPFFDVKNVIFSHHKKLNSKPGNVILDDKPSTLEAWSMRGGTSVKFCQPWNELTHADEQVTNWIEFYHLLHNLT